MDNPPQLATGFVVVLLACPAVYFLVRGLRSGPRPRRFADLALFCGLTVLVMPETALGLPPADRSGLFHASGVTRILLGITGVSLAVAALVARRDGRVGLARPLVGAGFSVLHLLAGVGLLLFGSLAQPTMPWVYQSPDGDYRLTLPGPQWKQRATTDGREAITFVQPVLGMRAGVLPVKRHQTEADFWQAVEVWRGRITDDPQRHGQAQTREGINAAGNFYHYYTGMTSSSAGKPVFIAYSVTWCAKRNIVAEVMVEGLPTMISQTGRVAEMGAFEKDAEAICLSVE